MKIFDRIAVIYNPKNVDNAAKTAKDIADSVNGHQEVIQTRAVLFPCKHGDEMSEMAYDITCRSAQPLIITIGNNSEYNDVINGIMQAKQLFPAQKPVAVYLPAHRTTGEDNILISNTPLIRRIKQPHFRPVNLLAVTTRSAVGEVRRYAYQSIGFGIGPGMGAAISEATRTHTLRLARLLRSSRVSFTAIRKELSSIYRGLLFLNSDMRTPAPDGFTVAVLPVRRFTTLRSALQAVVTTMKRSHTRYSQYAMKLVEPITMLCDDYPIELPAETSVAVKFHPHALDTIF